MFSMLHVIIMFVVVMDINKKYCKHYVEKYIQILVYTQIQFIFVWDRLHILKDAQSTCKWLTFVPVSCV